MENLSSAKLEKEDNHGLLMCAFNLKRRHTILGRLLSETVPEEERNDFFALVDNEDFEHAEVGELPLLHQRVKSVLKLDGFVQETASECQFVDVLNNVDHFGAATSKGECDERKDHLCRICSLLSDSYF